MSVHGIGIDLCDISRISDMLSKHADSFAKKILHKNELQLFCQSNLQASYLAKRFAAKEAFVKALGVGLSKGIALPEIEVWNDEKGKPHIQLHGMAAEYLKQLTHPQNKQAKVHLSLSDEQTFAIAQVLIEI